MNSPAPAVESTITAEDVLQRFSQVMRALHQARGARPSPWADCPLTIPQLKTLGCLAGHERGLIGRELAANLGVGPSAVTPLIDRLVEQGFAQRREDPVDRRVSRLVATEAGLTLLERMSAGQASLMRDILGHLNPSEIGAVGAAFDVLLSGVQRVVAENGSQAIDPLPSSSPRPERS